MNSIIVLGHSGMLGHQVYGLLKEKLSIKISGKSSKDYDFTNKLAYEQFLRDFSPNDDLLVINCMGMLRQRLPKFLTVSDYYNTMMINTCLPQFLSERYRLLHVTTDCVFSGLSFRESKAGKYKENDRHDEMDLYGKSKSMGEPVNGLTIRTSIIGPEISGRNLSLYEWFINQKSPSVNGYTNHLWNGVTTKTLAKCILKIITTDMIKINGCRHLFSDTISKYQMLEMFNKNRSNPIEIKPVVDKVSIDRTLDTNYPEFNNCFDIPSLSNQILDLKSV